MVEFTLEEMLALQTKKHAQGTQSPHEQEMLLRQINAQEKQIDALTYQLYGLTKEEIELIETAT